MIKPNELLASLIDENDKKIGLIVADGLGGFSRPGSLSALNAAKKPNLDSLAVESSLGLHLPVGRGITPGSGPAHLGLFGYDPLEYEIGRGALSAAGVDFKLEKGDVAARMNFATLDAGGTVVDRRAGRISTEKCAELSGRLETQVKIDGVQIFVRPEREHRAMVVFRGVGLSDNCTDTDPQATGKKLLLSSGAGETGKRTSEIVNEFSSAAIKVLQGEEKANAVLLRGFAGPPDIPQLYELFKLKAAVIAVYPMYRGLSRLVGMDVLDAGEKLEDEVETMAANIDDYNYFFLHYKYTDSRGEDGDFDAKVRAVEDFDEAIKRLRELPLDVMIVTGDHSTPWQMAEHSWHPVPILMNAETLAADGIDTFTEESCRGGSLGTMPAVDIMKIALAAAGKLKKYGA